MKMFEKPEPTIDENGHKTYTYVQGNTESIQDFMDRVPPYHDGTVRYVLRDNKEAMLGKTPIIQNTVSDGCLRIEG